MKKIIEKIKKSKKLKLIIGTILVVIIFGGLFYYQQTVNRVQIENSQILAPVINISPTSPGKLKDLYVYEGEKINKGDPIATVDTQTIYSETGGLVISANNQTGGNISSQTQIVQMINPIDMRVVGTIDENKGLNNIKIGQVVSFSVDAIPGTTYWGYVDEVSPTTKQTQLSFSISSERPVQQFLIYARFNALSAPEIKNGMSAKMTVYTKMP